MYITNEAENVLHETKQLSNSDMYIYIYNTYICYILCMYNIYVLIEI